MDPLIANLTLPSALLRAAEIPRGVHFADDDGDETYRSWAAVLDSALRVAGALAAAGLRPGDRVGLVLLRSEEFVVSFLGASMGGFVPVPMYPPTSVSQSAGYVAHAGHILRAARAVVVLTDSNALRLIEEVRPECPELRRVLLASTAMLAAKIDPRVARPSDTAFVQFTSGSTSQPKGVLVSHQNLAANIASFGGPTGMNLDLEVDTAVSWLPLFHDMGLIGMLLGAVYHVASLVLLPPGLFLRRPISWLKALSRHKGAISFGTNFAYDLCVKRVKSWELAELDLSSWRIAGCGAEPIQPETLEKFAAKFASVGFQRSAFYPCYGMAEHTLAATLSIPGRGMVIDSVDRTALADSSEAVPCPSGAPDALSFVGCGRPLPDHELRIVDAEGRTLPERRVGEVSARGPSVMPGYHCERETQAALRDGWLRTGDLGYLVNGELYVCGRIKEVIIINGRNCYAPDIEWAVGDVEGVRKGNVVAFGTRSAQGRERVVVVAERRGTVDRDQLTQRILEHVHSLPGIFVDEVVVVPTGTIPKTSSGKLQRTKTKARYEQGALVRRAARSVSDPAVLASSDGRSQLV